MNTAIITIAGLSRRFNEGVAESDRVLKALHTEGGAEDTLLFHLLRKCAFADRIVLVGGYRFDELQDWTERLRGEFPQAVLVKNDRYADLGSGYSLFLGIREALRGGADEILFAEGDLDVDDASFARAAASRLSVLTYNTSDPIYANKAVVLYADAAGRYKYLYNSAHGLLSIPEPFSCVLNSGQVWKFTEMDMLQDACEEFYRTEREATNLAIIQRYVSRIPAEKIELIHLKRWTNCNTREDYRRILKAWRNET